MNSIDKVIIPSNSEVKLASVGCKKRSKNIILSGHGYCCCDDLQFQGKYLSNFQFALLHLGASPFSVSVYLFGFYSLSFFSNLH